MALDAEKSAAAVLQVQTVLHVLCEETEVAEMELKVIDLFTTYWQLDC